MYTPNFTRRTYDELLRRAQVYLSGDSHACVVLDASYQSQQERNRLRAGTCWAMPTVLYPLHLP